MGLVEKTGACVYCGQMGAVKVPEFATEAEVDKEVSLHCDCKMAKEAVKKRMRIEQAQENVQELFGNQDEIVVCFLKESVRLVGNDLIKKIKVDVSGNVKATISMTAKNMIKVEQSETKKKAMEN